MKRKREPDRAPRRVHGLCRSILDRLPRDVLYHVFLAFLGDDEKRILLAQRVIPRSVVQFSSTTKVSRTSPLFPKECFTKAVCVAASTLRYVKTYTQLAELTFAWGLNEPLGNALALNTTLVTLTLGARFNQPLGNSLDTLTNLRTLTFGTSFNQSLVEPLRCLTKLSSLTLGSQFCQPISPAVDHLESLTSLTLPFRSEASIPTLTSLRRLSLWFEGNAPLGDEIATRCPHLTHLLLRGDFNQKIARLPASLLTLELGYRFQQPVPAPFRLQSIKIASQVDEGEDEWILPRHKR